jgi:hypothetical protein
MPSSSALIPMSICTLQCLFSHSFTTYEYTSELRSDELGIDFLRSYKDLFSRYCPQSHNNQQLSYSAERNVLKTTLVFRLQPNRSAIDATKCGIGASLLNKSLPAIRK